MFWIDEFLDAVSSGLASMDFSTLQPIDCFDIFPLYAKQGTDRILKIINTATVYNPNKITPLLHSPSVIRAEMLLTLIKAKIAGTNKKDLLRLATFYYSFLQSICPQDPFALQGTNCIHSQNEIKLYLSNLTPATPAIAKELGKLSSACYHLAYALYSDINPQICYDNFGPYAISDVCDIYGKDHILVIKQFQNLRPIELWQEKISDLPYNNITLYCIYKNIKFSVDNATHTHYEGDIINGLISFAVQINGILINDLSQISNATNIIGTKAIHLWQTLTSLDFEQAKIKYLKQRCYNYIGLCTFLNIDWQPTTEMLHAVKDKPLAKDFWPIIEDPQKSSLFWRELIDPRIDSEDFWAKWKR